MDEIIYMCYTNDDDETQMYFLTTNLELAKEWSNMDRYHYYDDYPKLNSKKEVEIYFNQKFEII